MPKSKKVEKYGRVYIVRADISYRLMDLFTSRYGGRLAELQEAEDHAGVAALSMEAKDLIFTHQVVSIERDGKPVPVTDEYLEAEADMVDWRFAMDLMAEVVEALGLRMSEDAVKKKPGKSSG